MEKKLQAKLAMLEYERYLKEAEKSAKRKFAIENPQYKGMVDSRSTHIVWEKRPSGFSEIIPSMVKLMSDPSSVGKTQAQLIEEVESLHSEHKPKTAHYFQGMPHTQMHTNRRCLLCHQTHTVPPNPIRTPETQSSATGFAP